MKNTLLLILFLGLISCSGTNYGGSGGSYSSINQKSAWIGDLEITDTGFLTSYNLCGNARRNIKRDLLAVGIIGLLTGERRFNNYTNAGLGILWNRHIINNCRRINKATVTIFSDQPYLPEGESIMFIEFLQQQQYYSNQRGNGYYEYKKLENYIKAGRSRNGGSRLVFHETRRGRETSAKIASAGLWYQSGKKRGKLVGPSRPLHITVSQTTSGTSYNDRDLDFTLRRGNRSNGSIVGESTLIYVDNDNYQSALSKANRQVASFFTNLKTHYLLLSFAAAMVLLIMMTVLFFFKETIKKN